MEAAQQYASNLLQAQANYAAVQANAVATQKQLPVLQAQREVAQAQLEELPILTADGSFSMYAVEVIPA